MNEKMMTAKAILFEDKDSLWPESQCADDDWGKQPLTQEEVQELGLMDAQISLWSVVKIQIIAGLLVIVIALLFGWWSGVCAGAGVLSVCLPTVVFVWRVSAIKASHYGPNFTLVNFYCWEFVKIVGIIAMLIAAFFLLKPLIWQALLAGFVVTIKAYAIGCWLSLKKKV